jgi:hypothetical protein
MSTRLRPLICVALLALACQQHEFQPLQPVTFRQVSTIKKIVARQFKPNVMLAVDRSQSMNFPIAAGGESRWHELKAAMAEYLTTHGTVARMGLMTFPTGDACGPGAVSVPMFETNDNPADLQKHADDINAAIQATQPGGVTPTMESLRVLANYAPMLGGRESIVILATDGLPNCNAANPNSYDTDPAACDCTFDPSQCGGQYTRLSCLDRSGTIAVVKELLSKGIKTAVVAFGDDTLYGVGPQVMNAIASEGGAPRSCVHGTDAECGAGNTCDVATHVCSMRYSQASSARELADALASIGYDLSKGDVCVQTLDVAPADARYLTVVLDGKVVPPGPDTWSYDQGTVTFHAASCQTLGSSTPDAPAQLEFRAVEVL